MIPMSCPSCGRRGTVPPDRLNTRMHCKKCDAVFYMDKAGHIVLGDPDKPKRSGGGGGGGGGGVATKAKAAKVAKPRRESSGDSPILEMIAGIPTPAKVAAGVVLVLVLAFMAGLNPMKLVPKGLPSDLDSRVGYASDNFADERPSALFKVAVPGTEDQVQQWYDLIRPKWDFEGPQRPGKIIIGLAMKGEPEGNGMPVTLRLRNPTPDLHPDAQILKDEKRQKPSEQVGYNADGSFDVQSFWVQEGETWMLDGARSLELATKQPEPPAETKTAPRRRR